MLKSAMSHADILLATTILFSLGINLSAQSQSPVTEDGSTELTISVKNEVVKVGDALTLCITMKNMHKDKYCHKVIGETGRADLNGYKVELTDSGGNAFPMLKQRRLRAWSVSDECLNHGKATSEQMEVSRLTDLSKSGVYHMRVSHLDIVTNRLVWSNSITVTIAP
jgi:hypothetical protein